MPAKTGGLALISVLLSSCAAGGFGGEPRPPGQIETATQMSQSDKAEGAKAHPELLKEFGGLYEGPQAGYVAQIGRKVAVQSSLSSQQSDFTISLLNSSVNNAFAIPGGYVYVTRQLMALMNDEAELAGVLGHEVGHVAAEHSQRRQSAATRNSILGVLGQVLVGAVAGNSGLGGLLQQGIGTGTQLLTLQYSRSQEYEADDLGIRYLARAGYDPTALSSMLRSLAAQTALDSRVSGRTSGVPEWASTHPDPASRVERALQTASSTGATSTLRNKSQFLSNVDGILYGEDPEQGVVQGGQFLHPTLRVKFSVPQGYGVSNQPDAVIISSQSARAQFGAGRLSGGIDRYVQSVFAELAGQGSAPNVPTQRTTINGIEAAYGQANMTNSDGTPLSVTVVGYAFDSNSAYHFIVVTPQGQGLGAMSGMINSVARMSAQEAAQVKPRKVHLVRVKAGDTASSLARQMAYDDYQLERFLVLNGLEANDPLPVGASVKLVTY